MKALLPQLELLSTQHLSGAYKIVGVAWQGGARLDLEKSLRAQAVPPGGALIAIVEELHAVFARAARKAKAAPPKPAPPPEPAPTHELMVRLALAVCMAALTQLGHAPASGAIEAVS